MKNLTFIITTLITCSLIFTETIFELGNIDENNGSIEVLINTESNFMGFQLDVNGVDLTGGAGGLAEQYGFDIYASGNTALGFSLEGNVIPSGSSGILTVLQGEVNIEQVCLPFVENVGPEDDTPILSD